MNPAVEWFDVAGPIEPWRRLGLHVDDEGFVALFGPGLRIGGEGRGVTGWSLSGVEPVTSIDGLPTAVVTPHPPVLVEHPIGAIGLDHVVVVTGDLERTSGALQAATGAPLRRVREVGELRQGFHRLGSLVVELVERAGLDLPATEFWGLVVNVEDLDAAVDLVGPALIGEARDAVQPGRRIATVREEAGLGLPVALMTP